MIRSSVDSKPILTGLLVLFFISSIAGASELPDKRARFLEKIKHLPPALGPTDDPPPPPVIAVAEWEPMTGVLINYEYPGGVLIPWHLVVEMAEDVEVMTVVADERRMLQALDDYAVAGVNTSNCTFLFTGTGNGPYTRDYGPWYLFNGNDELGINDNVYTPAGNPDDLVNQFLGASLGIPVYQSGLNADGGNWMTDGMGIAMTTNYTYVANWPLTPEEIDGILEDFLGISNHLNITISPIYWHIDTFAKMLDPGRIMIIQLDPPNASLEAAAEYISTLMSSYGRPYEVFRVQGYGYSNTLFLNNKVLVPLFGEATDSMAVVAYQEAMPGYDVQGFYYSSFTSGDALHCRTHEMADPEMLRIVHVPIHDCENDGSDYYLEADIHPYSGEALIGPPLILWKVEGGSYTPVAMTHVAGYTYAGEIPQQPDGTDIYYYIEAEGYRTAGG
jgi:agmatine/peptidylarginine deiminase